MKRFFTFIISSFALGSTVTLQAQCLKVYSSEEHMVVNYPLADASTMPFSYDPEDGYLLSLGDYDIALSSVDSIVVDKDEKYVPNTVVVSYNDKGGAWVTMSNDLVFSISDYTIEGNKVSLVASDDVDQEINYILRGTSVNGSFFMDGNYKATLTLDGISLTNPDGAALSVENGKRINVVLSDGSINSFADGASGTQKACFFINGHAEVSGSGVLNITSNARHAYASDEYTILHETTGTINILASANDGLHVGQYFKMDGGVVNVKDVKGDCVDVSKTKNADDEQNGWAFINGGTLNMAVTAEDVKGLKCDSSMTIKGGTILAKVSGNGGKGISVGSNLIVEQAAGATTNIQMDVTGTTYKDTTDPTNTSKCRGIKVKGNYTLRGGNIYMNVTGKKAKGISIDGTYTYEGGTTNVVPE